jgi:hypothetical protein
VERSTGKNLKEKQLTLLEGQKATVIWLSKMKLTTDASNASAEFGEAEVINELS